MNCGGHEQWHVSRNSYFGDKNEAFFKIIIDISGLQLNYKSLLLIKELKEKNESKMNAEGLDTLAPFFGLFALFFIGSCFICACYRRCCSNKTDKKQIDGEYVKYGAYFDRSYNENIDENNSDEQQRSSTPAMIDKPENIER